jgi:hypothetical protein
MGHGFSIGSWVGCSPSVEPADSLQSSDSRSVRATTVVLALDAFVVRAGTEESSANLDSHRRGSVSLCETRIIAAEL